MKELIEIREGWHWPKDDVRCWRCFQRNYNLPQNILKYVDHKNICIQAGGNTGVYVKQFADVFKTVYTFEPESLNFYCLSENLKDYDNVVKYNAFVGQKNKPPASIVRFDSKKNPNTGKFKIGQESGTIPVMSIDDLNLESCDLIQLDVEGGEYHALLGAVETIKKFNPLICLEWFENQQKLYELLTAFNYKEILDLRSDRIFIHQNTI